MNCQMRTGTRNHVKVQGKSCRIPVFCPNNNDSENTQFIELVSVFGLAKFERGSYEQEIYV